MDDTIYGSEREELTALRAKRDAEISEVRVRHAKIIEAAKQRWQIRVYELRRKMTLENARRLVATVDQQVV